MERSIAMYIGQWADMPLETLIQKMSVLTFRLERIF